MNINKYIEYLETKFKIAIAEKKYKSQGYEIKYILEECNSDILVIIFSGCTRKGVQARYNYNRTLKDIKVNKLFILDNYGDDKRGVFYLGYNYDFKIESVVKELIENIIDSVKAKKIIYVGSSKGGYAALNFGIEKKDSYIIAGAPQYHLDKWLNWEGSYHILRYIVGEVTKEKLRKLRNLLPDKIKKSRNNQNKIFLHFSKLEHTYSDHIKYLLEDMNKYNYNFEIDEGSYTNHADVSKHFPNYLISSLNKIIGVD